MMAHKRCDEENTSFWNNFNKSCVFITFHDLEELISNIIFDDEDNLNSNEFFIKFNQELVNIIPHNIKWDFLYFSNNSFKIVSTVNKYINNKITVSYYF